MEEIWKSIEGYDGYYEISNLGNVKSHNSSVGYKSLYKKAIIYKK